MSGTGDGLPSLPSQSGIVAEFGLFETGAGCSVQVTSMLTTPLCEEKPLRARNVRRNRRGAQLASIPRSIQSIRRDIFSLPC
eukprot:276908-Pyramimonas_sp.AAC.1